MNKVFSLLALAVLVFSGCATGKQEEARSDIIFPPPPDIPRVQYITSIQSKGELPNKRSSFADFVLGPEPVRYVLAKPNVAKLRENRLYVADTILNAILVFNLETSEVHSIAGDRGAGKIRQPNNFSFDEEGNLYVADKIRESILIFGPDENFINAWGRRGEVAPVDVEVGREVLYVLDIDDHEIEVWDRQDGSYLRSIGGLGKDPGQLFMPTYLALDENENIYVTDTGNFRIQKLSPQGEPLLSFGGHGVALGQFAWPKGLDVDSQGRIYVADSRFANVQIFNDEGQLLLFFGGPGPDQGFVDLPAGVSLHPWPDIPWLSENLVDGFVPEFLALVVNQHRPGVVNLFAVRQDPEEGL